MRLSYHFSSLFVRPSVTRCCPDKTTQAKTMKSSPWSATMTLAFVTEFHAAGWGEKKVPPTPHFFPTDLRVGRSRHRGIGWYVSVQCRSSEELRRCPYQDHNQLPVCIADTLCKHCTTTHWVTGTFVPRSMYRPTCM